MIKRTTSFLLAWLFTFSLLSNCYCQPATVAPVEKQTKAGHCQHHDADKKSDRGDCDPRYQADHYESTAPLKQIAPNFVSEKVIFSENRNIDQQKFLPYFLGEVDVSPGSPPQFFVLHHAFLI